MKLLDKVGNIVDRWTFTGACVDSVYFDTLSYGESGPFATHVGLKLLAENVQIVTES